jgi:hypothetical protein
MDPLNKDERQFVENFLQILFEPKTTACDGELQPRVTKIVDALYKRFTGQMTDAEIAELEGELKALSSERGGMPGAAQKAGSGADVAIRVENPFGFPDHKDTPDRWDCPADFLQAEAFMIAERYLNAVSHNPDRRLLAIGEMQGFMAALRAVAPAETFNHYLGQFQLFDPPGDHTEGFLDHLEMLPLDNQAISTE